MPIFEPSCERPIRSPSLHITENEDRFAQDIRRIAPDRPSYLQ